MVSPTVIDNGCCGVGDGVVYSWALHSANAREDRLLMYPRGLRHVFNLLNASRWCLPDPEFSPKVGNHPPKGVIGGKGWLRGWLDEWGQEGAPFVRPTHNLTEKELDDASARWQSRECDRDALRVLIFPEGPWPMRVWPEQRFMRLAWMLHDRGSNAIALLGRYRDHQFPFAIGGLSFRSFAAMIATADIVIGNESGPVHLAATLGTKAYCLYGPTRYELMHEQYGDLVVPITATVGRVPCAGCNFEFNRGCRQWCDSGCLALGDITPWRAFGAIQELITHHITIGGVRP